VKNSIWLFTTALLQHWLALMSCAAFTFFGVYIAATNRGNSWVVGGSAVLAALFFVVAAYKSWRDEHDRYMLEVAKNQKPEIKGEAFNFTGYGIHGDGQEYGHWSAHSEITFELYLCNQRPITTNLKSIHLDGSRLVPPVSFALLPESETPDELLRNAPLSRVELPHGTGKTIKVKTDATVDNMRLAGVPPIVMDNLQIRIVDAFDQEHPIRIRSGERVILGRR
jgi:hypothetical protein